MKEYTKADEICDFIIKKVKSQITQYINKPHMYWKYGLKAAYIKSKQMQICMDFKAAKLILESDARTIL